MQAVLPISMVPGNSVIHKISPLPKFLWVGGVLIISFATRNPAILGGMTFLGLIFVTIAQIWKPYLKVMRVLFPIFATRIRPESIAPAFPRPWTPIANIGPFTIYQIGIYSGLTMELRIYSMTTFALVAIMTTHPATYLLPCSVWACPMC